MFLQPAGGVDLHVEMLWNLQEVGDFLVICIILKLYIIKRFDISTKNQYKMKALFIKLPGMAIQ